MFLSALKILIPWLLFWQMPPAVKTVMVSNPLNINRPVEEISIPAAKISGLLAFYGAKNLIIKEMNSGELMLHQPIDTDANGTVDEIIFQTNIAANQVNTFSISGDKTGKLHKKPGIAQTYARFVPERIDDFAWENDRVAFRTYGPKAQQITEDGSPGGTLTSGIDCWLKRVSYPIINKWYRNDQDKISSYHTDSGEGYDPYHVNSSRGCGGIGVWANGKLNVSKNFTAYKVIATGPIRTIFELSYAPWKANGITVTETKRISLDLGSHLSRFEIDLKSSEPLPNVVIGLTQHEKKGKAYGNQNQGWFRYWEPMDDAALGVGLVLNPRLVTQYQDYQTIEKDQSHIYVFTKPNNQKLIYYAGFGWSKNGHYPDSLAWDNYLEEFAKRMAAPLQIKFAA